MDTFQMECLKDGTWSNRIPTCKSKQTLLADDKGHGPQHWGDVSRAHTGPGEPGKRAQRGMGQEFYRHSAVR